MVRALRAHDVVVFAQEVIPSELLPAPNECEVRLVSKELPWPWTILRHVLPAKHRVLGAPHGHFDVYLHLRQGSVLTHLITSTVRGINPAGGDVRSLLRDIPIVLSEAPGGEVFAPPATTGQRLLPPPLIRVSDGVEPVSGLPDEFLLTVFNPYEPVKGADILARLAPTSALPIVWCFSDRTVPLDADTTRVPGTIPVHDPSQGALQYLYSRASGYVSFSRREGFGWAVADALLHGLPVLTRKTGCVHFVTGQSGITLYEDEAALEVKLSGRPADWLAGEKVTYDLSSLSPERFVERLQCWVGEASARRPSAPT
jgi:hypothetical protein